MRKLENLLGRYKNMLRGAGVFLLTRGWGETGHTAWKPFVAASKASV
jgi:hypothetical protein